MTPIEGKAMSGKVGAGDTAIIRQDAEAHEAGYLAGQQGKPNSSPYSRPESNQSWSWASGYIEGKANPDKPYPRHPKAKA